MNRRELTPEAKIIPARTPDSKPSLEDEKEAEAIIFDKADEAEAKEGLHYEREQTAAKIEELKKSRKATSSETLFGRYYPSIAGIVFSGEGGMGGRGALRAGSSAELCTRLSESFAVARQAARLRTVDHAP